MSVQKGEAISRAIYRELFRLIGTFVGEGNGASTTFELPKEKP